jgi:hypothetical protein
LPWPTPPGQKARWATSKIGSKQDWQQVEVCQLHLLGIGSPRVELNRTNRPDVAIAARFEYSPTTSTLVLIALLGTSLIGMYDNKQHTSQCNQDMHITFIILSDPSLWLA